jgi:hypothetical protein
MQVSATSPSPTGKARRDSSGHLMGGTEMLLLTPYGVLAGTWRLPASGDVVDKGQVRPLDEVAALPRKVGRILS